MTAFTTNLTSIFLALVAASLSMTSAVAALTA